MGQPFSKSLLPALALLTALVGCGGNGNSRNAPARTASMQYSVEWPDRSRAMPQTANSAVVTLTAHGQTLGSQTVNRPQDDGGVPSSVNLEFQKLPAGDVTVTVTAYPELNGQGTEVAKGSETVTLVKGQKTVEHATLASTATTLEMNRSTLSIEAGKGNEIGLTAKDARGFLVPLNTSQGQESVEWKSDNVEIVSVLHGYPDGADIQALNVGTAHVTATFVTDDAGAKIFASTTVTVTPPPVTLTLLTIEGGTTMTVGAQHPLTAKATYSDDTTADVTSQVVWSTDAPASITSAGVFTTPAAGTYTVTANLNGTIKTFQITVNPARSVVSIAVTPNSTFDWAVKDVQLTAIATYSDGSTEDVTSTVTWVPGATERGGTISVSPSGLFHWETLGGDPRGDYCYVSAKIDGVSSNRALIQYALL